MKNELKIRLSPSQIVPVKLWVERLVAHPACPRFAVPRVIGNVLEVHPWEFVRLLTHFSDTAETNEFDLHRLKAKGVAELKKATARKKTKMMRGTYESCLSALEETKPFSSPYYQIKPLEPRRRLRRSTG